MPDMGSNIVRLRTGRPCDCERWIGSIACIKSLSWGYRPALGEGTKDTAGPKSSLITVYYVCTACVMGCGNVFGLVQRAQAMRERVATFI